MEYLTQECSSKIMEDNDTDSSVSDKTDDKTLSQHFVSRNGVDLSKVTEQKHSFWQGIKKRIPFMKAETSVREAIEELIEEDSDSDKSVEGHERALISNILDLRDLPVIDVMIPRVDILAIDIHTSRKNLLDLLTEKPHSRLPVYHDTLDNIVGSVHMKDMIAIFSELDENVKSSTKKKGLFDLKDFLRNVLVVSPSMRVLDLLLQMRQSKVHMAIVVDEYGGTDGLITINDLVEAIVGEIDDEHGLEIQPQLVERKDGTILADARYPLDDFEELFGPFMEEDEREDVDTLGGLVNIIAGHVPTRGEIIVHKSGIEFEIMDADPRRVHRLCIRNVYK